METHPQRACGGQHTADYVAWHVCWLLLHQRCAVLQNCCSTAAAGGGPAHRRKHKPLAPSTHHTLSISHLSIVTWSEAAPDQPCVIGGAPLATTRQLSGKQVAADGTQQHMAHGTAVCTALVITPHNALAHTTHQFYVIRRVVCQPPSCRVSGHLPLYAI